LKIGIIGLEFAGKKTLMRILSNEGKNIVKKGSLELSTTQVVDPRIEFLSNLYKPKKTTFARLEFVLTPSITGDEKKDKEIFSLLNGVDGLILILRDFCLEGLPDPSPEKNFHNIKENLIINDLIKLESITEKFNKRHQKSTDMSVENEKNLIEKCKKHLEKGLMLFTLQLTEFEESIIKNFDFLSRKPMYVLVNVSEDKIQKELLFNFDSIFYSSISLGIEEEIFRLEKSEQEEFLLSLGLKEPALNRVIRDCYRMLDLISFFTTGEDEVKAWTVKRGTNARSAAGTIHSDMERGFIRAEVISYDDFVKAGSEKEAKKLNLYRLEGKDYIVQDGDIIHFRFNV